MTSRLGTARTRHLLAALAVVSVLLLGCARKLQIEVPAGFHGHVHITCADLTTERASTLRASGAEVSAATCPARQADTLVVRAGDTAPLNTTVMWTTTGDGLVRDIQFDVK